MRGSHYALSFPTINTCFTIPQMVLCHLRGSLCLCPFGKDRLKCRDQGWKSVQFCPFQFQLRRIKDGCNFFFPRETVLGSTWDSAANLKERHQLIKKYKKWWQGTISYSFKVYYETQWTFQQEVLTRKKQENLLKSGPYISSKRAGLRHTSST